MTTPRDIDVTEPTVVSQQQTQQAQSPNQTQESSAWEYVPDVFDVLELVAYLIP